MKWLNNYIAEYTNLKFVEDYPNSSNNDDNKHKNNRINNTLGKIRKFGGKTCINIYNKHYKNKKIPDKVLKS